MDPEVQRLRARVEELESRLLRLERRAGIEPEPVPEPVSLLEIQPDVLDAPAEVPRPAAVPPPIPVSFQEPLKSPPMAEPEPVSAGREDEGAETKAGLVWMNRVGAVTVIFGVIYLFKYAVDSDWIGPAGRVICGVLAGALAVFAADRMWHRGHKIFAQGLTATGITTVFLSFAAAYQMYHLIPQTAAFVLLVLATAAGGALAVRYSARVIAILALFGGYLAPFLVSTGEHNDVFFGTYLVLLNAAALFVVRRRRWLSVEIFAGVSTSALLMLWVVTGLDRVGPVVGGASTALQFGIFVLSPFAGVRYLAALPLMIATAGFCQRYWSPMYWTWALAMLAGGIGVAVQRRDIQQLAAALVAWAAGFMAWDPSSSVPVFAGLSAGFVSVLGAAVWLAPSARPVLPAASTLALNALFFFGASYSSLNSQYSGWMGLLALGVAGCYLGAAWWMRRPDSEVPSELPLVAAGLTLAFVTLAVPIQLSGYTITLAWAVECAVLAFLAARLQNLWPFAASWITGLLALGHLLDHDANTAFREAYSPVLNSRFIPFVVTAVCYAINAFFTQKLTRLPAYTAAAPLLAAHGTLLFGLHTEAYAWIQSRHPANAYFGAEYALASSILIGLYGFVLVSTGIAKDFRPHRILGLALFALVVVKLYLYDIWELSAVYRIFAFVALGALLLLGSYTYSRYRARLLALVRDKGD